MKSQPGTFSIIIVVAVLITLFTLPLKANTRITVGSKKFTESVILGEIIFHIIQKSGKEAVHRRQLGGTRVLWNALLKGDINIYPEYTGTISEEILAGKKIRGYKAIAAALKKKGILMTRPLGFNNTYIIGMRDTLAAKLNIERISDLKFFSELRFAFSNEFMDRQDGWPGLKHFYGLPQQNVRGIDHDLAYRGLESGTIDAIDLYSTDAEIQYYGIKRLTDDFNYFQRYEAVFLYQQDLKRKFPGLVANLQQMEGAIDEARMTRLNARSKLDKIPENKVAAEFLASAFDLKVETKEETTLSRLFRHTGEHLLLVFISLTAAILVALPLGIAAAKFPKTGQIILGVVGIIQTIPSLALLVFMIPLLGIGGPPALMALFLYSLLPIVRNTHDGLRDIPIAITESAQALGLPPGGRLLKVELPLCSRMILAGIKTSAVINVGTATLGALIGAGGYGQPILTGIRLDDVGLILQGAIPAAALAILVQFAFVFLDRIFIPKGLRIKSHRTT